MNIGTYVAQRIDTTDFYANFKRNRLKKVFQKYLWFDYLDVFKEEELTQVNLP